MRRRPEDCGGRGGQGSSGERGRRAGYQGQEQTRRAQRRGRHRQRYVTVMALGALRARTHTACTGADPAHVLERLRIAWQPRPSSQPASRTHSDSFLPTAGEMSVPPSPQIPQRNGASGPYSDSDDEAGRAAGYVPLNASAISSHEANLVVELEPAPPDPEEEVERRRENRRKRKFLEVLADPENVDLAELRKLAWSGCPSELRPMVWQLLLVRPRFLPETGSPKLTGDCVSGIPSGTGHATTFDLGSQAFRVCVTGPTSLLPRRQRPRRPLVAPNQHRRSPHETGHPALAGRGDTAELGADPLRLGDPAPGERVRAGDQRPRDTVFPGLSRQLHRCVFFYLSELDSDGRTAFYGTDAVSLTPHACDACRYRP